MGHHTPTHLFYTCLDTVSTLVALCTERDDFPVRIDVCGSVQVQGRCVQGPWAV
jgi:hypothetical protein